MRRITNIHIDNYRAYIEPKDIKLPEGENLLIYGENGSGKSSLYKALRHFLASSVNSALVFEVNHFSGRADGCIAVTYTDVDAAGVLIPDSEHTYTISTDAARTDNGQNFIKTSHRASGFLDYTQLLKVYLNNGSRPNLFKLVIDLLGNYVPTPFFNKPLREVISSINSNLTTSYHRTDHKFQTGLADYNRLATLFPQIITQLNGVLTPMMTHHFQNMGLKISLVGAQTNLDDPYRICDMSVDGEVYVDVKHHGATLPNYNDRLNEARLSAIATCLYLSSLKLIANTHDTRILFLDDVFIGLDLGNRLPVLDIIKDEYGEYQRIVTTYDKSWFAQAKEALSLVGGWKFYEMYEGEVSDGAGNHYVKPIVVETDSLFGRACSYLNNIEHPDYPAAANYLRKAFEELLQIGFYDKAIRNENFEIIAAHSLTSLVKGCREFVAQMPDYVMSPAQVSQALATLDGLLHPLLHPLSHYVPDVPTYKAELKMAVKVYEILKSEFLSADYDSHCKVVLEKNEKIEFVVKGTSGWENKYVLRLSNNLYWYDDNAGVKRLSLCQMRAVKMEGKDAAGASYEQPISGNSVLAGKMVYSSLLDCYNKITHYIANVEMKRDAELKALEDMFLVTDKTNAKVTLTHVLAGI